MVLNQIKKTGQMGILYAGKRYFDTQFGQIQADICRHGFICNQLVSLCGILNIFFGMDISEVV